MQRFQTAGTAVTGTLPTLAVLRYSKSYLAEHIDTCPLLSRCSRVACRLCSTALHIEVLELIQPTLTRNVAKPQAGGAIA